ncbi:hypothetical protein I316_08032 [Kwoniella heveanensis BCC8398]|uniref:Uncharacterized protein n=1 Tax=Kwoniella heveanensis BCC8398 TaxID=1296120 RepID=A0A1B9GH39_9TREE|nr:hypothetical protein I316_08032 [Kwoniella heveanensis BCC8398]
MRFTSPTSRPSLTPMGYRLLHLSEMKLSTLDGISYDEGKALHKGVLVREAVKNAWRSVEEGSVAEMNDWSARGAMGLDVVSEEEEDDEMYDAEVDGSASEERKEQQWFENLISSFGEDESYLDSQEERAAHEWVESNVSMPEEFEDFQYDAAEMVAFTFPVPISPTTPPTLPVATRTPAVPITLDSLPSIASVSTDVDVIEVVDDDEDDFDDGVNSISSSISAASSIIDRAHHDFDEWPHHHLKTESSPALVLPGLAPVASPDLTPVSPMYLDPRASPPYIDRPEPADHWCDLEEYIDDFFELPPPLIRSLSSSEDLEECSTPPLRCSELNEDDIDCDGDVGVSHVRNEGLADAIKRGEDTAAEASSYVPHLSARPKFAIGEAIRIGGFDEDDDVEAMRNFLGIDCW